MLLLGVVAFNGIFLFLASNSSPATPSNEKRILAGTHGGQPIYYFQDPVTSYQILEQLDIFSKIEIDPKDKKKLNKFNKPYMALIPDMDYCKKHRALMVQNPEIIFTQKNIITSQIRDALLRSKVIPVIGKDIMPKITGGIGKHYGGRGVFELRTDVNNFFTFFGMYGSRALGRQYSCLSQTSNSIPGHQYLYRKDFISEGILRYAAKYENRSECFNFDKFFPETWILYHEKDCKNFFEMFNSERYQKLKEERGGIVYMRKIGRNVHQGMGVFPINDQEETKIKNMYKNGELCGKKMDNNIIQYFIYNPLLLHGHKFDFRIYTLIASSNTLMAFYHDGFLRVSLHSYNPKSKELGALLTNTALSKSAFSGHTTVDSLKGMTSAQLKDFHLWNFTRLENYLYENGVISDRNWLENYLRPEFGKAIAHLIRMSQESFMKISSVYHLFGFDFMLDANLNLWFIEANASPALEGFSAEMKALVKSMLTDHFEIVYGLMKSRMKRVILFVNSIVSNGEFTKFSESEILIHGLIQKREHFQKITQNYFEHEFVPRPENKFQPVINENLEGEKIYYGLIKKECF